MSVDTANRWLEVEEKDGIRIVRFVVADLLDDENIDRTGEQIRDLIQQGCHRLVLHFGAVRRIASHMLGELVVLLKHMLAAHGCLLLCGLDPELRETFALLKLDRIFTIRDTEEQALQCCRDF